MSGNKVFTVFGSTGNQGSSVINSILADPELSQVYKLRGITRNTDSSSAKVLAQKGVEMVSADLNDYASVSKAIAGSYAVFAATNYWENPPSKEREVNQGKRIADACKLHDVKQLVFSSLPGVTKLSNGKYTHVEHFDSKAEISEYIKDLGLPHVNVIPGMFVQNFSNMLRKNDETGGYIFAMPLASTVKYPWFNPAIDTGAFVAGALRQPELFNSPEPVNIVEAAGFWSGDDVCRIFTEVTGLKANYFQLPEDQFIGAMSSKEIGLEMLENMLLVRDYGYFGPTVEAAEEALKESIAQYFYGGAPQNLKDYFVENKDKF